MNTSGHEFRRTLRPLTERTYSLICRRQCDFAAIKVLRCDLHLPYPFPLVAWLYALELSQQPRYQVGGLHERLLLANTGSWTSTKWCILPCFRLEGVPTIGVELISI